MRDQAANDSELLERARHFAGRAGFSLRAKQEEVLRELALGRSVFAGLPTGYGKSACYWIPAGAWGWRVWVVSPLVSLIEDQALACGAAGVRSLPLRASRRAVDRAKLRRRLEDGDWQVCFLSPERLERWGSSGYLRQLRLLGLEPDLLVLDEMHCLEEWRSFRPAYAELYAKVKTWLRPTTLLLGLSASMPAPDSRAWMEELCGEYVHVGAGLGRENLNLSVIPLEREEDRWLLLLAALRGLKAPESALIYCGTRRETDEVARWLSSCGLPASAYHAGRPAGERSARTEAFRAGHLRVVCATTAFGMGIDYPHVSRVIHFSMPHDLESYWQEVGRAGRSGEEAHAVAFWRRSEASRFRAVCEPGARARLLALWRAWLAGGCRKRAVAERLGAECEDCGRCDRCTGSAGELLGEWRPLAWWAEPEAHAQEWLARVLHESQRECVRGPRKNSPAITLDPPEFPVNFFPSNNYPENAATAAFAAGCSADKQTEVKTKKSNRLSGGDQ